MKKPPKVERKWKKEKLEVAKEEEEERQARSRKKHEKKILKKHE
jgi:hypothetical protein